MNTQNVQHLDDEKPKPPVGGTETPAAKSPKATMQAQYVKSLSFQIANAPEIFQKSNDAPDIKIKLDVKAQRVGEAVFETVLSFDVEAKVGDDQAFTLALSYGVLTAVDALDEQSLKPLLLIEVPRQLFPFARNVIANITRDGGFAPLMLQPIDFAAMFHHSTAQGAADQQTVEDNDQSA